MVTRTVARTPNYVDETGDWEGLFLGYRYRSVGTIMMPSPRGVTMRSAAWYQAGANAKCGAQASARPVLAALALAILSATACRSPTGVPEQETLDGARYTSYPSLSSDTPFVLIYSVVVKNVSRHTQFFTSGACPVGMRAYRSADRLGAPVYDAEPGFACIAVGVEWRLPPDSSATFGGSVSAADLRAAEVPAGHYWFASVLKLNGGVIELAAGDATFSP